MPRLSDVIPPAVPYLSHDERAALVRDQTDFMVLGVRYDQDNRFGPRWLLHLQFADETEKLLGLPANDVRDRQFRRIADTVSLDDPLGPVLLREAVAKNGQTYYELADPGEES